MGAVDGGALKAGLLGASSSANFMRQMRNTMDGTETPDLGTRGATSSHVTTRTLQRQQKWKTDLHSPEYLLPPRSTVDRLMNIYWKFSHVIFPFLDKVQITECYEGLWTGCESLSIDQQIFHCILNTAFAIACKLDPAARPEEQEESSNTYFLRARKLLSFDLLDMSHFQLIQALLLMSQYLQSTNMPRGCFQSIGLAIWIAQVCSVSDLEQKPTYHTSQDMGLHLPETSLSIGDQHQRAMAQRVWQGCILMDRYASIR